MHGYMYRCMVYDTGMDLRVDAWFIAYAWVYIRMYGF